MEMRKVLNKKKSYVDVKSDTVITGVGYTAPFLSAECDIKLSLVPDFIEDFNVVGSTNHAVCEEDRAINKPAICLLVHCLNIPTAVDVSGNKPYCPVAVRS